MKFSEKNKKEEINFLKRRRQACLKTMMVKHINFVKENGNAEYG